MLSPMFLARGRDAGRRSRPASPANMLPEFGDLSKPVHAVFAFRGGAGAGPAGARRAASPAVECADRGAPPSAGRTRRTRSGRRGHSHVQRALRHDLRCRARRHARCVGAGQAGQWHRRADTEGRGQGRQEGTGRLDDHALRDRSEEVLATLRRLPAQARRAEPAHLPAGRGSRYAEQQAGVGRIAKSLLKESLAIEDEEVRARRGYQNRLVRCCRRPRCCAICSSRTRSAPSRTTTSRR